MKFSIGSVYKLAVLHIKDVEFEEFCSFWATDFSDPNFLYVNTELSSQIAKYCAETSTPHSPEPQELCLAKYEGKVFCWSILVALTQVNFKSNFSF